MGRIIVSEFVTLDGVTEDPAGDEGFELGGWVGGIRGGSAVGQVKLDEARAAEALLLGRRSYEFFAARWPSRDGQLAARLNSLRKYVVTSTLVHLDWNNSTVLDGDVIAGVAQLRQGLSGDIVVHGSLQLVRTLVEHNLVDELRLLVHPVVLGAGERLFDGVTKKSLRLVGTGTVGDELVLLTYQPVRNA